MGKKVSTKTSNKNVEKQLHNLIKVLKPKVYITDSSSFKQLVQELRGYRSQTTSNPKDLEMGVPLIEIEDHHGEIPAVTTTTTLSTDSLFASFELCDDKTICQLKEINEIIGLIETADNDNISMFDHMSTFSANRQTDWLACQNLESWLLDAEAEPYHT